MSFLKRLRSGVRRLADVGCLKSLRTLGDVELHALALGQGLEALTRDRREMHEHVLAAFLRDEPEALRIVEPLHRTHRHFVTPCLRGRDWPPPVAAAGSKLPPLSDRRRH